MALGLVSRVAALPELQAEAAALAADMLRATPLGLRLTKDALNLAIDAPGLEAAIAIEDPTRCCARRARTLPKAWRPFWKSARRATDGAS